MATQLAEQPDYDRGTAETILRRLTNGETMLAITRDIGIDRGRFYAWKKQDPDLEAAFEEARLIGAEMIAQDALRIVDGDDLDDLVPMDLEGVRGLVNRKTQLAAAGGDPVARARLRFEGRMKLLAKWFPQHYGDKLLHAGHDGGAIKSETALSVKELAQQLRARASGLTIEGDVLDTDNAPRTLQYAGDAEVMATGTERSGAGLGAGSVGEAGGKRRSRGVGDRGGALKRGASAETGGTPPTDIFSENSTEQSTTCFPPDTDWSPEDYV